MRRFFLLPLVLAFAVTGCGASRHATPVAASSCGPVQSGGAGTPKYLIVSDLPLRAPPGAKEQVAGIEYLLRSRHFKAGAYTIGYQSCDDSSAARGQYDDAVCSANAKSYARNTSVIGVIGPYNSECASLEIPLLESSSTGPLAMIGTGTTDPTLTASVPGGTPGWPKALYPKGVRNFVRLSAPDQYQAVGAAMFARQRHLRRVFVLDDGEAYGTNIAQWFEGDARRLRVGTAGTATWNIHAKDFAALAARVAKAKPDGVFLSGLAFLHGTQVLKAVRAALGSRVVVFAPDGFSDPNEDLAEAKSAANGLYFTLAMVPPQLATGAARTMLRHVGPESMPEQYGSLFGAAAAATLMDAVAASDGTRKSVTEQLFLAQTPASFLGRFGFNADGDPTFGAITVYQIVGGKLRVDELLRAPSSLAGS